MQRLAHLLVKAPRPELGDLPHQIEQLSKQILPRIEAVISGGLSTLDYWAPGGGSEIAGPRVKPSMREHIKSLRVPLLHGKPNVLLHDLGNPRCDPVLNSRINEIFMEGHHT